MFASIFIDQQHDYYLYTLLGQEKLVMIPAILVIVSIVRKRESFLSVSLLVSFFLSPVLQENGSFIYFCYIQEWQLILKCQTIIWGVFLDVTIYCKEDKINVTFPEQ